MTDCNGLRLDFHELGRREIRAEFDGGTISSDAGGLLLRELDERRRIVEQFSNCFTDHRDPERVEHRAVDLIRQRVFGLCLGYEDLNDHDELRNDPRFAVLVGKADPAGQSRVRSRDRGKALAGKSTLNRLELTRVGASKASRYKKIVANCSQIDRFFVDVFLQSYQQAPKRIVLDLDATDDPLHGDQLGRFFHGYYKSYCYMPLYIFCGDHLLAARLRPSNRDASFGSVSELSRIVSQIRSQWPTVEIVIRADSGFCREPIMAWCEGNDVHYMLGLAKNDRLEAQIAAEMSQAKQQFEQTRQAARVFKDISYRTLKSWSRSRRVVAKAEYLPKGENPRFVVTSFAAEEFVADVLYEQEYCARGEMENRIKEQQLFLFADRTSAATMRANQLRLWLSSVAYTLLRALREYGLQGTVLGRAQCDTIRLKLFKIGARVRITFRKIWISFTESYPYQQLYRAVCHNIRSLPPIPIRC